MKKTGLLVSIFALTILIPSVSFAQGSENGATKRVQTQTVLREETAEQKCEAKKTRVRERVGGFDNTREKHMSVYGNIVSRLEKIKAKAIEAKKPGTDKLSSDISLLNTKIAKFENDYKEYRAKLDSLRDVACGSSDEGFKAGLAESKTLLATVHQDAQDIRDFIGTTIKEDLKALKGAASTSNNQ